MERLIGLVDRPHTYLPLTGFRVPVSPTVDASTGRDSDDR
jgi:hypothetical protein